jgi:ubiquinone/menaquinone biosynthesis C-methylase UbiE
MSGTWTDGDAYERFMGRWSSLLAQRLVDWLEPVAGARWVDVGSGTGALTEAVLHSAAPAGVVAVDPSPAFTAYARSRFAGERVTVGTGDAQDLPVDSNAADYVVAGLVLNFVADPQRAVGEMVRVARTGGTVACTVWDYAEGMQMLRIFWDAATALDPRAAALDEARFAVSRPDALARVFTAAGLTDVRVGELTVPTVFAGVQDFWEPFLGGQGAVAGYVAGLESGAREALAAEVRGRLPVARDGRVHLTAKAWAARGLSGG